MRINVGDRVRVVGEPGEFTVMRVDPIRHVADLMGTVGIRRIQADISLTALRGAGDTDSSILSSAAGTEQESLS